MKIFNSIAFALLFTLASFSFVSCDKKAAEYEKNITEADGLFNDAKYDDALKLYNAASTLKPDEGYPKEKISEINEINEAEEKLANEAAVLAAEENYLLKIEEADDLFNNANYEEAISVYVQALSFKPDQRYPVDRINEIELLLEEDKQMVQNTNNIYHIVVGSFEIENNALELQQKLKDQGVNARLVSRFDGEYTAVIFASYPTLNEAYNNLSDARSQMEHAWVIYKRFD